MRPAYRGELRDVLDAVSTDAFQRAVLGVAADVRALLHRPGVARATFGSLSAVAAAAAEDSSSSKGPETNGGVAVATDSEVLERALSLVEKQAGQMLSAVEARRAVLTDLLNAEEEEEGWRGGKDTDTSNSRAAGDGSDRDDVTQNSGRFSFNPLADVAMQKVLASLRFVQDDKESGVAPMDPHARQLPTHAHVLGNNNVSRDFSRSKVQGTRNTRPKLQLSFPCQPVSPTDTTTTTSTTTTTTPITAAGTSNAITAIGACYDAFAASGGGVLSPGSAVLKITKNGMLDVKRELAALIIDRLLGMRKVRREMEREREREGERERDCTHGIVGFLCFLSVRETSLLTKVTPRPLPRPIPSPLLSLDHTLPTRRYLPPIFACFRQTRWLIYLIWCVKWRQINMTNNSTTTTTTTSGGDTNSSSQRVFLR